MEIDCPADNGNVRVVTQTVVLGAICVRGTYTEPSAPGQFVRVRVVNGSIPSASAPPPWPKTYGDVDVAPFGQSWYAANVPVPAWSVAGSPLTVFAWLLIGDGSGGGPAPPPEIARFNGGGPNPTECCSGTGTGTGTGSGTGSGGTISVPCCPGVLLPALLHWTISNHTGAGACLNGKSGTLTYIGGNEWQSPSPLPALCPASGDTGGGFLTLGCGGGTWTLFSDQQGTAPCFTFLAITPTSTNCSPFQITATNCAVAAQCGGGTCTITITN